MQQGRSLASRINRAFALQAAFIGVAVLLSVFFAKVVLDRVLINAAIEQEAEYYWERETQDASFLPPDTLNLTGYESVYDLPEYVVAGDYEGTGFFTISESDHILHISERGDRRLYLLYYRGQVDALAAWYGMFPLAVILILLYVSMWATYRFSRRAVSPVIWLAHQLNQMDFDAEHPMPASLGEMPFLPEDEIKVLADSLVSMGQRLDLFVDRERHFTRDASHELRSPLTVIRIAADMLLSENDLDEMAKRSVQKIQRATEDMEGLTEAFLMLARESDNTLSTEDVLVNEVVHEEIERARMVVQKKGVAINIEEEAQLTVVASDKVLSILLGNLIRNALQYTDKGEVSIRITDSCFMIHDTGVGIPDEKIDQIFRPYVRGDQSNDTGYGVGLTIVKRLSDRFGWPLVIQSTPGEGTFIEVCLKT